MPISKTMGKIIIHGKIVEVGGPSPMVKIEHPVGAPITLSTSYGIAKFLGKHLYEKVVIFGSRHPQDPVSASITIDIYNIQIMDKEDGKEWVKASTDFEGSEGRVYMLSGNTDSLEQINPMVYSRGYSDLPPDMQDLLLNGSWKYNQDEDGN